MDHNRYREWLTLQTYNDLKKDQVKLLEEHLQGCESCRVELKELQQMHSFLQKNQANLKLDGLLQEARTQLRSALREERGRRSFWQEWTASLGEWWSELKLSPQYSAALAGVFMFAIGILAGSFLLNQSRSEKVAMNTGNAKTVTETPKVNAVQPSSSTSDIANVRFIDSDAADGEVEIAFDAVKPMKLKGSMDDPAIQKVLTYAVLKEQNPGVRLRAVSAIGAQQQEKKAPDPLLKAALISALKFDKNAGVRKEALDILQKYPMDDDMKAAFLQVLIRDENPGMRVAAMKYLGAQDSVDPEVLNVLKGQAQNDQNAFVRSRAIQFTDEVKQ
jgi:hypothetical protein